MSRIKNTALIKWTNMNILEEEINSQFSNNPTIDIKDVVIFAKISPYSYYPIETAIDDEGKIRIKNSEDYVGLQLFVGSRCQFLHKRFTINDDSYRIELDEYFKTAWNPKKFIIFQDGYLMNPGLFTFIIPSFENNYYRKYIYSTTKFKKNHGIDVYYIESDDNFSSLPVSRDMYVGAIRYIARKNNEKIVPIPYPFKDKKSSFFIFNEQGHYLDKGTDYVVSYDEVYITLKRPLKLATVDYIIFAFPIIQKEKEIVEPTEVFDSLSGYPYFKYSYSVEAHYNVTGLVRFLPIYEEYVLTKKNFLLFGDGEWINPNRFEVHSNDAIIFNNRADQEICANIHYTMVIFEDNTDHTQFSLPRDFFVDHIKCKEPNQRVFKVEHNAPFKCKSFVIFKNKQLVTEYYFDEDSEKIHFKNPVNEDFYLVWFSTQVNNTNQEILVYTTSFPCYKNGSAGTAIPENYVLNNLTNSWVLVFLDGKLLNPTEYKIRDGKVYLNSSVYTKNGRTISLEGSVISLLLLISGFKKDPIKRTEKQIQMIQEWQEEVDYDLQETAYFYIRTSARPTERGVIPLLDRFDGYKLNKRNMLLFSSGGTWIDPQRFNLIDNDRLYLVSPLDHERSLYTSAYYAITMDDKLTDKRYSPPNIRVVHVKVEEDYQSLFEIPKLHRRFRTFILFKGSLLLNKEYNYVIENETHVKLTHPLDYMRKGRSLTFVFLDAHSRIGQETIFIQSSFKCKLNQATPIPNNFLHKRFNTDHIAIFLNGLFMSPDKYKIINNSILLDGFIELDTLDTRIFTILYITSIPIGLRHYDYFIPPYPDIPIKELDIVPDTEDHYDQDTSPRLDIIDEYSFSYSYSTSSNNGTINFSPSFEYYPLEKNNFLLFGNGYWINPNRFNLSSNIKFSFISESDKQQSNSTNYTIIIPNEGHSDVFEYSPITFNLSTLIATQDHQQIFDLPELTPYSTLLVFNDEGLLIPVNERVIIKNNHLIFKHSYDYLQQDQSLHVVILDDSNIRDQYPAFIQDTFNAIPDISQGTPIPSDWYMYEDNMLVFFEGQYLSSDLYTITDHKIFLDSNFANQNAITSIQHRKKYTLVYLDSNIIEEDWEKVKPPIDAEPTPKRIIPQDDPLDFTGYYFDIYESKYDVNGYITYDPGFTAYSLTKADFLLFGNSTFIHPSRYTFNNNKSLRMIDPIDRRHSPFALYNMVIPFSKDAKDFYKEDYVKPKFQIVEIVTTERTNELEFPVLDAEYESVLMFRNSLILPIYDEDRFVIDDINHKFMIVNEADWIPANTTVTFIFMSSKTNTDTKILLVQDSFKCVDYFTQIPNSVYRYPGQKFNKAKMLLYLNGTFVVPERYVMHNNTIFLVDDDIDLNDDHTFTIVYLDEVHSTEYDIESNIIDRTYEDIIDDIIIETEVVKPI